MNAPKLRFKEFSDEWISKKLFQLVEFSKGNILAKADLAETGNYPCILYGQLYTKYNEVIRKIYSKTNINENNIPKSKKGDVLIPSSGETPIDISTSSCIQIDNVLLGGDINILRPISCDGRFLSYLINNNKKTEIAKVAQGHSVVHLYNDNLKQVSINIPSIQEQKRISDTLELLDKKIELQTKKIEDLKLFKKGLIRDFYNEYNLRQIEIKEIGKIVTGTTPSKSINSYWDNGNITWVTPTDINDSRDINDSFFKITDKGLNKGKFIPKNSVLVTCIASIGKNAILKVDGSCNQQINAIIPNKNFNYNYVYYLIESISNYMKSIAGTSATSIINKEEFSKIIVKVHSKEKQDYIASVLSQFEIKILLEISKLNKFYQLKKGLMQNMFV